MTVGPEGYGGPGPGGDAEKILKLQHLLEAERKERAADVQKLQSELDAQQQVLNEFAEQLISLTDGYRENLQTQKDAQQATDHMAALESAVLAQEKQQATLMDLLDLEREARGVGFDELGTKLSQELMLIVDLAEKQGEKLKQELDISFESAEKKHARLAKDFSSHCHLIEGRLRELTARFECWEMRYSSPGKGAASTSASGCDGDDLSTRDGCETSRSSLDETRCSMGSFPSSRSKVFVPGIAGMSALAAQGAPRTLADIQSDLRNAYQRLQEQCDTTRTPGPSARGRMYVAPVP